MPLPEYAPEPDSKQTVEVPAELAGERLDVALARLFPDYSRSRLTRWLREGAIRLDGRPGRPGERIGGGEQLQVRLEAEPDTRWQGEPGALDTVHADEHVIVINKPAGLVTHPGAGNYSGTLVNRLLHHYPELAGIPRAGIVHRLDKDTSGLLVCARSLPAHTALVKQLQERSMHRVYAAVVKGVVTGGGTVDEPIGRDPRQRTRMAVTRGGRTAVTHYRVAERFRAHSLLEVQLETGRTHQIRVHMAWAGYPLVGDATYAARNRLAAGVGEALRAVLLAFPRQALHARRLAFLHPDTAEPCRFEAALPADLQALLAALRTDAADQP